MAARDFGSADFLRRERDLAECCVVQFATHEESKEDIFAMAFAAATSERSHGRLPSSASTASTTRLNPLLGNLAVPAESPR
jgi:hypothetical protein